MTDIRKAKALRYTVIAVVSLCAAGYAEAFAESASLYWTGVLSGFAAKDPQAIHFIRFALLWAAFCGASELIWRFHAPVLRFAFRYRYLLALAVLVVCVLFEISGSSIAQLAKTIDSEEPGVLFGIPRSIRADEYATFTPMIFSQQYNASGAYPYFSETIRGALTDTGIIYALPSWNIATLFRPFLWGFLLMGPAKGLSFFWVARLLALFLVSFEFAMVFTKKDRWLSLTAGALIALAPIVQWWFAINGIAEMLIFGQGALLCTHHYLHAQKTWKRALAALLFFWCGGIYLLTIYPAWQIPLLYVFAALFLGVILENRRSGSLTWKRDLPIIAGGLAFVIAGLLPVIIQSADTIQTVVSTVYPGNRVSTGGGGLAQLFRYGASLFLPIKSSGLATNPCETSLFFDLAPAGILLALYVVFVEKKRDRMLIPLLLVQALLMVYCAWGLPEALAKLTLLSRTTSGRTLLAVGLGNILLLLRAVSVSQRKLHAGIAVAAAAVLAAGVSFASRRATGEYLSLTMSAAITAVLFVGLWLAFSARSGGWKKLLTAYCVVISLFSGGLVNPVQRGVDVIYQSELVQSIQTVVQEESGLWIVEGGAPLVNVPIMAGAPTINSTNVYPHLQRWRLLDPTGQYEAVYNRYAHISVSLTEGETTFTLRNADYFQLVLNFGALRTLNVRYVLSEVDYSDRETPGVSLTPIAQAGRYFIYALSEEE